MSRDVIQLNISDLSQFTKTLRKEIDADASHSEMLSHVARAAGYRNYQHLRARNTPVPKANDKQVARALRYFSEEGHWLQWPHKRGVRELCCWVVWAAIPPRQNFTEREISALIDTETAFRDAAQIRRALVELGAMERNLDGSVYRRIERPLPPEAAALIRAVKARR
ncbi:DUF2087 domain-containing protein [Epibacterium sp. SM1969]|uniref:DUF2087 domain-containing protein n=1 Tax=Tritonibacter aquimaris TaxID=2663379 RepID=A0A844AK50_9RHOB|nr:DUF2087 domain-containing protein [Tritonibacter aquimaris]MQY41565.1 DUF2087 domain-containing protein [Tritonibacter aquimaris]